MPFREDRFPEERASSMYECALWDLWALSCAEEALQWPTRELGMEIAARPEYAAKIREIYKMLCFTWALSGYRRTVVGEMLGHIESALQNAGQLDADAYRDEPIDFSVVPGFRGVDAWEVTSLRPIQSFFAQTARE